MHIQFMDAAFISTHFRTDVILQFAVKLRLASGTPSTLQCFVIEAVCKDG